MLRNKWVWFAALCLSLGGVACGDDAGGGDGGGGNVDGGGGDGGGGGMCDDGPMIDPLSTAMSAETGSVTGKITWDSTKTMVPGGLPAAGDLYVAAILDFSPSCPEPNAVPEPGPAQLIVHCADFEATGEFEYTLYGLPVGVEVTIVPFLDTDLNVDGSSAASAGPSGCDLSGLGETLTISAAGEQQTVDLPLSTSGDFIAMLCGYDACGE